MSIKKEIELFKFSELSDEAKERAIEKRREDQEIWLDYTIKESIQDLQKLGIINPEILYSGFHSQGDGACFTCDNVNIRDFLTKTDKLSEFPFILSIEDQIVIKIVHNDMYYHEKSVSYDIEFDINDEQLELHKEEIINFEKFFEEWRIGECKRIYKALQDDYEYLTSRECIIESIEDNDYLFWPNGNLY